MNRGNTSNRPLFSDTIRARVRPGLEAPPGLLRPRRLASGILACPAMAAGLLALGFMLGAGEARAQGYEFLLEFGGVSFPLGVGVDPVSGNILASSGNNIEVFNSSGTHQFTLGNADGSAGSGDGQFDTPLDAAVGPTGNIVVTDRVNARVQVFDAEGDFLFKFGSGGSGNGQFTFPRSVVVDPASGNILVADRLNHRIQVFDGDGNFLFTFGSQGSGEGQFDEPSGVGIAPSGDILVADTFNRRIQVFDGDGEFLFTFGSEGSGDGQFRFPEGVVADPASGDILVADALNHRIQVFDGDGNFLFTFGSQGSGEGQFNEPHDLAVAPSGNLVVVDRINHRIQVFAPAALDADGDGVQDDVDACVPTAAGEVVNAEGCSIADLVPCHAPWKNHGAYVSAIARTAKDFLEADLITAAERGAIVAAAGTSQCGNKNGTDK